MSKDVEYLILASLIHNRDFSIKAFPHAKEEYFDDEGMKAVFSVVRDFEVKYRKLPTEEALRVELESVKGLSEDGFQGAVEALPKLFSDNTYTAISKIDSTWMAEKAENYFKDKACFMAIMKANDILDGTDKKLTRDAIPDILKEALNVTFDVNIGHDYLEDAEKRFEFYHKKEDRIKTSLSEINRISGGGLPRKSLIVPIAPTGVGKSLFLTNEAAHFLLHGHNVLYITLEMSEFRIGERIDAKLMDMTIDDLRKCPLNVFNNNLNTIKRNATGKIVIREYPPGTFHANHLRFIIKDIRSKLGWVPDVVMVDYLGLMASYRMKDPGHTYTYQKAVTEELRGVMMEFNCLGISPNQTNRDGQGATDYDLTNMADSHGVSMTADMIFGFIETPDLAQQGHMRVVQLKNRFGDLNSPKSFLIGVNKAKMQMYDLDIIVTPNNQPPTQPSVGNKPGLNRISGLKV